MKRSAIGGSGVSPDYKSARGESNMGDSSFYQESIECIQEESETPPTEPNLKDTHNIHKSIQSAISVMQSTIAKLVKENNWALHVCPIKRGFEGSIPLTNVLLSKKIIVSPALKNDLYNILNKI